ncbi:MAG: biosynthetic peptidoglycan transglycosylase [Chitinivibrionales bacterium]
MGRKKSAGKKEKKKHPILRTLLIIAAICLGVILVSAYPAYRIAKMAFHNYFDSWGERLVSLEKRGLLSQEYGAAWKDVLADDAMTQQAQNIVKDRTKDSDSIVIVDGIAVKNYPSLSIIRRLNEISSYSNTIEVVDRKGRRIGLIRTNHTRGKVDEFPETLIQALLASEDKNFYENDLGFEFDSFVRAALRAVWESATSLELVKPRGTSTITQQVAKLFISDLDELGRRIVSSSVDRKIREMKIASALRKMYTPDEILEVYLNHCVTSDYGLVGYKDIARGLLGKAPSELTDDECIYLARMVKWGRNIRSKIVRQAHIDMPRMADALSWDQSKQQSVFTALDSLSFTRPKMIYTDYGHLVDLANEFWLKTLEKTEGEKVNLAEMDIIDPNSLIRRKGNLRIQLTIDLPLQRELERLVNARGFGPDTTIYTDVRIGSYGEDVKLEGKPRDTLRMITIIDSTTTFSEADQEYATTLQRGDTLVTNIRYVKKSRGLWRKSIFYYTRRPMRVDGQYYAYCILDSKTGKLLAYYSRDKIGSRMVSLLHNRTPNGSSTAKPILNALNFDMGVFKPFDKWDDRKPVPDTVPWARTIRRVRGKPVGVTFKNSAVAGRGYKVANHGFIFEGCNYVFDHLATSNNILGTETIYRLNKTLFGDNAAKDPLAFNLKQFFYRIGAFGRLKNDLNLKRVTGVRVYKELARIIGVNIDSMTAYGRRVAISDSLYSVSLGTLELTLYEQAHMFNMLYNNDLIERPADHPSLAVSHIMLNDRPIAVTAADTVRRYHPFADVNNIRPTYLGLHKRLTSNRWDGLSAYDIPYSQDTAMHLSGDSASHVTFDPQHMTIREPMANYAKSGTSDDVLRPFNVDVTSNKRTNYCLWNAVIRIDMSKLSGEDSPEIRDITIACVGEGNNHYTGPRDGKTLHKYVSRDLLKKAGIKGSAGYYAQYENYLKMVTPDSVARCGEMPEVASKTDSVDAVAQGESADGESADGESADGDEVAE